MSFAELPSADVPPAAGVYVVFRANTDSPVFLARSGAGWFKDKDPSVGVEHLESAWLQGASVLYIGKASSGTTGRRGLRKRLDEYRRHGSGEPIGH